MERKIFVCECYSLEHQVAFWYDEGEKWLYIQPRLVTHRNLFKRLWVGIRYAFGYKCRFGEWDDIILDDKSQQKLLEMINQQLISKS